MSSTNIKGTSGKGYEPVLFVYDYWDQPRKGVAHYRSAPYYFDRIFDDSLDAYSEIYRLTPLGGEALRAALEIKDIFLRWRTAFDSGKVDRNTHPALPEDAARYKVALAELEKALEIGRPQALRAQGRFVRV